MFKLKSIFILFVAFSFFLSCKKDKNVIGNNVQPAEDALNAEFTNKLKVIAYTKKYDSIACYNGRYKFIGVNNDPIFGYLNVGLYLNANLNVSNWKFDSTAKLRASEIILVISGNTDYLGDKNAINNYTVFQLTDSSLSSSRVYLSNNENLHNKNKIISQSALTFTVLTNGKLALRIPIDTTFSGDLMRRPQYLVDNEKFLAQYKGFYIKTSLGSNQEGTIYKCDLEDDDSGYFLRYRANSDTAEQVFRFGFSGNSAAKFNTISYSFNNANPNLFSQLKGDTAAGNANLFLKGLGATKIRLYIPELKSMADSFKVAVNRAEVSLYLDNSGAFSEQGAISDNRRYNIPLKLALLSCDSTGKENYILDQTDAIDAGRYDGGFDGTSRYVFNIARHVQAILTGKKKNYGFYVVVADPDARYTILRDNYSERVVLAGSNNNDKRPILNLSYIKFKNP